MMIEFDVETFLNTRELENCPPHFLKANTPVTGESLNWVKNKLRGRYSLVLNDDTIHNFIFSHTLNIYFEDHSEATMYELRWAGNNFTDLK